jgi:hypothetical protein
LRAAAEQIVQEVAWVVPGTLLLNEVNRAADNGSVVLFELGDGGEQADGGWVEHEQCVFALPPALARAGAAYLDVLPHDGYNHLALFAPVAELATVEPELCGAGKQADSGYQAEETAEECGGRRERPNDGVPREGTRATPGPVPLGGDVRSSVYTLHCREMHVTARDPRTFTVLPQAAYPFRTCILSRVPPRPGQ